MNQAFHLLYSDQLDIIPQMRLQVVSPILLQEPATNSAIPGSIETSSKGGISVTIKSQGNLVGYEIASYAVQTKAGGPGINIVPLYADRHIGAETEHRPAAAINYFQFPGEAAFYRVFYEAEQTEYTALIIAARTRAELERRTKILETGAASCESLNNELCVAVPKQVAINGLVPVTVNGNQILVNWRTTIGGIVRAAGGRESNVALQKLAIFQNCIAVWRSRLSSIMPTPQSLI